MKTDLTGDFSVTLRLLRRHCVVFAAAVVCFFVTAGFECLLGWLYLQGRLDRVQQLFDALWAGYRPQ